MNPSADIAHLLRRTGFGPHPGRVEELEPQGYAAALESVLEAPEISIADPPGLGTDDESDPALHWLAQLRRRDVGLHEMMVFFWHGHLTSSVDVVGNWSMMWNQHRLLRRHALGNFRTLLHEITVDPAMLIYLNGDASSGGAPNENYGRELMELFALGRGAYQQADVRAAARALAGWRVDWETASAYFDPESAYPRPVQLLGRRGRFDAHDVVDIVCDNPACAPFVAAKLSRYFTGVEPSAERIAELGAVFADSDLEIRPLIDAILRDDSFRVAHATRPRTGVEWTTAALLAIEWSPTPDDEWRHHDWCQRLAQVPFRPPNVAGWPDGLRWVSAGASLAKSIMALDAPALESLITSAHPVRDCFHRCGLYAVSESTLRTVRSAWSRIEDFDVQAATLLALVLSSPEFALA